MKRYYSGLLVIHPLISTSCSSLTISVKNITDYYPPLEQAKHTQAVIPAIQTAPENKSNLIARFYSTEKSRRIPRWRLDDPSLLKIIKDNAIRIRKTHRQSKNIIRLEDWKYDT